MELNALSSFLIIGVALLGAFLPSLIWLLFFLREDRHPEPKRLIAYTFSAGALVSLFVIVFQFFFQELVSGAPGEIVFSVIGLALIEEIFKFLAAYWAVAKSPAFDEPVDAMIYMIAAALGFASVENIFVFSSSFIEISTASFAYMWETFVLRFFGATLLHTASSAILGFYWARGKIRNAQKKWVLFGIFSATLIHSIFNFLILHYQNQDLLIYPSVFVIAAIALVLIDFEKLKHRIFKNPKS